VLPCVALRCSMLQCVSPRYEHYHVQCVVVRCSVFCIVWKYVAVCCSVCFTALQALSCAMYCSVLQCVAVCGSVWQYVEVRCRDTSSSAYQRVAVFFGVLQCVAVCCSVLQCVAVRCSVLQCIAVHGQQRQRCQRRS